MQCPTPRKTDCKSQEKYADIRTRIDYEAFVNSSHEEQVEICRKNIEGAAKYIAEKDSSFKLDDFYVI